MATNIIKTRIQHKHDTAAGWESNSSFVPLAGELIIYDTSPPQIKIGNGETAIGNLSFIKAGSNIVVSPSLTSGTKVGTITVDGVSTVLYCQTNTNTTYSAGTGLSLSGTTFSIASNVLTTSNYTSYVPTKTGSGASGTWEIDISGNAATATADASGNTITSKYVAVDTAQTISGAKTFSKAITLSTENYIKTSDRNFILAKYSDFNFGSLTPSDTTGGEAFMKAVLAAVCSKYPGHSNSIIIGNLVPNSSGPLYGSVYSTSAVHSTTKLPQYSTFQFINLGGHVQVFGTYDYEYYNKIILDSSNYTSYTVTKTGSGASGTWGINITGNAATASKVNGIIPEWAGSVSWDDTGWIAAWNADGTKIKALSKGSFAAVSHTHSYLPLSGGTISGNISFTGTTGSTSPSNQRIFINGVDNDTTVANAPGIGFHIGGLNWGSIKFQSDGSFRFYNNGCTGYMPIYGSTVYGAVWNDYAEFRDQNESLIAGYITYCDDDGKLKYTTERLQKFEGIVSDTFGFAIGETDDCKTPLAVSGRVLVYCDPKDYFHSGDCVCAGPNGLAYRMTREEIIQFPDRIVGIVSEIPTYETWGTGNVKVNGRIWIKVR